MGDYKKLFAKKIGHVEIIEKINLNAYRLKLPSHIRTVDVFNVKHLIPYMGDLSSGDDDAANSRANFLHLEGMMQSGKGLSIWRLGTVGVVIKCILEFPVYRPGRSNWSSRLSFVDRIGQKLSATAPTTSTAAPKIVPNFPVSIQDDSRVSRLSFIAFFWL